jgi:transcriptional regulator with XRE-family HTH domain
MATSQPVGSLSARLREALLAQGYTLDRTGRPREGERTVGSLAKSIQSDRSTLTRWLDGERDAGNFAEGLATLRDLADALGVSFEWLALGRGPASRTALLDDLRALVRDEIRSERENAARPASTPPPPESTPLDWAEQVASSKRR